MTGIMYDSIDVTQIPLNASAVAGYTGGSWPTFPSLAVKFPNAQRLSIAVTSAANADCLDVETGDATVADAPGWARRQHARGVTRPCLYASASVMDTLIWTLETSGITRATVRLWSAHYGDGAHICGPSTCELTATVMDGTQWTSSALGRNLDQSLIADDFFVLSWQEAMLSALPTLQQGDRDSSGPLVVHRVQLLVSGIGGWNKLGTITQTAVDGVFGPSTTAGVKRIQEFFGLTQDGVVGPLTWAALVTGSAG